MKKTYSFANHPHTVSVDRSGDAARIEMDDEHFQIFNLVITPPRVSFLYQGRQITAHVVQSGNVRWVHVNGSTLALKIPRKTGGQREHGGSGGIESGAVLAPMPGQVRAVLVAEGDTVTEGQPLVILEAMKMELQVRAPRDGIVAKLSVTAGARVEREQVLGEIEEHS